MRGIIYLCAVLYLISSVLLLQVECRGGRGGGSRGGYGRGSRYRGGGGSGGYGYGGGLSMGAFIGIVAGSVSVGVIIIMIIVYCCIKHHMNNENTDTSFRA